MADEFEVQLVRAAAADEDSWVSMAFDRRGRVIIGKESRGLLRLTLSPDGNRVTDTQLMNDSLKECRGILAGWPRLICQCQQFQSAVSAAARAATMATVSRSWSSHRQAASVTAAMTWPRHRRQDLFDPRGCGRSADHRHRSHVTLLWTRRANQGHLLRIDPTTRSCRIACLGFAQSIWHRLQHRRRDLYV